MSHATLYPQDEVALNGEINKLMSEWDKTANDDSFNSDGFFPYYTHQKHKVLIVGREARGIGGLDFVDVVLPDVQRNILGGRHINRSAFFRRLMYIVYGIQHDFPHFWNELKPADDIAPTFGTAEGVSCAFMNISKSSNERIESWSSDWESISKSAKTAVENGFIREEVSLLAPEIIITLNIEGALKYMVDAGTLEKIDSIRGDLDVFTATVNGKKCHIFNTWHFAAPRKKDLDSFYAPIQEAYRKHVK